MEVAYGVAVKQFVVIRRRRLWKAAIPDAPRAASLYQSDTEIPPLTHPTIPLGRIKIQASARHVAAEPALSAIVREAYNPAPPPAGRPRGARPWFRSNRQGCHYRQCSLGSIRQARTTASRRVLSPRADAALRSGCAAIFLVHCLIPDVLCVHVGDILRRRHFITLDGE